jgi:hypothetical protein
MKTDIDHQKARPKANAMMIPWTAGGFGPFAVFRRLGRRGIAVLILAGLVLVLLLSAPASAGEVGRYQVIAGGEDSAYLVDTTSGAVWVLTHRTLATGREPVAIPYKFIQISPADRNEFLIETLKNGQVGPKDKEPVKSK